VAAKLMIRIASAAPELVLFDGFFSESGNLFLAVSLVLRKRHPLADDPSARLMVLHIRDSFGLSARGSTAHAASTLAAWLDGTVSPIGLRGTILSSRAQNSNLKGGPPALLHFVAGRTLTGVTSGLIASMRCLTVWLSISPYSFGRLIRTMKKYIMAKAASRMPPTIKIKVVTIGPYLLR
jgi:hypothetical protein